MREYYFYDDDRRLNEFPYSVEGNIFVKEGDYFHSPDGWRIARKVEEPSTGSGFYKVTFGPPLNQVVFETMREKLRPVDGVTWHMRSIDGSV